MEGLCLKRPAASSHFLSGLEAICTIVVPQHRAIVVDRSAIQRLIRRLGVRSSVTGESSDVSRKTSERLITMVQPKRSHEMTAKLGW